MADETRWCKIVERNGKKLLAFAVAGKEKAWYKERGFKPYGGIENPPLLPGRRTVATVPVDIGKTICHARIYADMTPGDYDKVMEDYIYNVRAERGYTLREPGSYKGSSVKRWNSDAYDWTPFLDSVMLFGLKVQNEYAETGKAPTLMEFKAALPKMEWTYVESDGTEPSSVVIEEHYTTEGE